jgi:hypothetical protein|tara:strand:- start:269 stop:2278 length:2010 start_codon:yes stop_codon:yes gene_type:complete
MSKIHFTASVITIAMVSFLSVRSFYETSSSVVHAQVPATPDQSESATPAAATPASQNAFKIPTDVITLSPEANAERNAYFGDLHVHTTYSFDAFAFGTIATPYDAYRYATGEAITHPAGFELKLRQPLDFYAVTDHAGFLGAAAEAADTSTEFSRNPVVSVMNNLNVDGNRNLESIPARRSIFRTFLRGLNRGVLAGNVSRDKLDAITRDAWADTIAAAEQFNNPGKFTTFVGYEFTASRGGGLHRNVIFRSGDKVPAAPFSILHSRNPENLWDWMDDLRSQGIEALGIPHNSNASNGQMFSLTDWAGNPMDDDYAEQRLRNEPLMEITQVKGTSETHPILSDNDEWAGFEISASRIASSVYSEPKGSYARDALLAGLAFEDHGISNPYKFGFIGSSDTHTGAISDDESNFFSKLGLFDSNAELRGSIPLIESNPDEPEVVDGVSYAPGSYDKWGASGVVGVWAEENTRDAIYDALRRKETFATSGPRIKVRFFAGFDYDEAMLDENDAITRAYAEGVSMGSDLVAQNAGTPNFIVWAAQDVSSAPLQRLQIIKGWTVEGEHNEKVYDVACSDGGSIDPNTQRCIDNGANVNLENCSVTANVGAPELKTVWSDPDFDPSVRAFYYARVLENPTCRWSTWDALRTGVAPRSDLPSTIQERAWSSPIWVSP